MGSGSGLLRQGSPRGAPARLGGPRDPSQSAPGEPRFPKAARCGSPSCLAPRHDHRRVHPIGGRPARRDRQARARTQGRHREGAPQPGGPGQRPVPGAHRAEEEAAAARRQEEA